MSGFIDIGPVQTGGIDIGPLQATANNAVGPVTVTHSRSIGTPTLTGGNLVITLASPVGPHRLILNPTISGPISGATVTHTRSIPSPSITEAQTIALASAVIGPRSIPSPRVAFVTVITMASPVTHTRSIPSPLITGGPQWINAPTVIGPRSIPNPTLIGGKGGVFLYLSGVNRSDLLSVSNAVCNISGQTLGRWTATLDLYVDDGAFTPQLGQTCLILDNGKRLFAGCLNQVVIDRQLSTVHTIFYHLTATDKSGICDHRVVTGATYPMLDTNGNPVDCATVILAIVRQFLNGEGITAGPEIVAGAFGNLSSDLNWNFPSVTAAFDQICSNQGLVWWVDSYAVLHFSALTSLPVAPFSLTETSNNWRNLTTTTTTTNYWNKLYAVSNLNVIPGGGIGGGGTTGAQGYTDTITFSSTSPQVVYAPGPSGPVAVGITTSVAIGSVISMTVNGNAQTVVNFAQFNGQTRTGSNDFLWFFGSGGNQLSWTFNPGLSNQTIVIHYTPYVATNSSGAQYGTALAPQAGGNPLGTCGSGIYEGVIQVSSINNAAQLNAIAAAVLARIGGVPTTISFETDYDGLQPGQLLTAYIPLSGLPQTGSTPVKLMLTSVSGTHVPGGGPNGSLGTGSNFRWQVQGTTNLDPGNWQKWYEQLVGRTNNPLPLLQVETAKFILGPGTSLSSGNSVTNPYAVTRTGQLSEIMIVAATPPVDQNLIVQFTRNNSVIATVTMLFTTTANQVIYVPLAAPLNIYVFKGDAINCNVIYQVVGSNPIPASNVTAQLSWSI